MSSNKIVKEPTDSFLIYADFSHVLAEGETLVACQCSADDNAGVDVTVEILEPESVIIGSGDDKAFCYVRVRNGKMAFSPYTVTMQAETSLGNSHTVQGLLVIKEEDNGK